MFDVVHGETGYFLEDDVLSALRGLKDELGCIADKVMLPKTDFDKGRRKGLIESIGAINRWLDIKDERQ